MELLFAYYLEYRNIKNQGFNFSSEYLIEFDSEKCRIRLKKNDQCLEDFFPKSISNVTVIVGENGVGKTSTLNIEEATFLLFKDEKNDFLFVCEDDSFRDKITITNSGEPILAKKVKSFDIHSTLFVKYSNYVDNVIANGYSTLISNQSLLDFSTNNIIKRLPSLDKDIGYISSFDNSISVRRLKMVVSEIEDQMQFLFEGNNVTRLSFKHPEKLTFTFSLDGELKYLKEISGMNYPKYYRHENAREVLDKFLKFQLQPTVREERGSGKYEEILNISEVEYAMFLARWSMFFSFINSFSTPNSDSGSYEHWLSFNKKWYSEPIETWFCYFFDVFIIEENSYVGSKYEDEILAWSKHTSSFIQSFENLLKNKIVEIKLLRGNIFHEQSKSYGLNIELLSDVSTVLSSTEFYSRFLSGYYHITYPDNFRNDNIGFMTFSWRGVSTGEMAMFRLFSRVHKLKDLMRRRNTVQSPSYAIHKTDSLVFLIDEGDLGFHPYWQKKFLSILIKDIPQMFEDTDVKNIQIILTTHSPFVLSDVTNSHVIFLEKGSEGECKVGSNPLRDKKNTFGANIHSLLSDGFFLADGLMGNYAKDKINELIDNLEEGNTTDIDKARKLVNQIGEPLIKKRLQEKYFSNLNVEDRIAQLEKEIENLKKQKQ